MQVAAAAGACTNCGGALHGVPLEPLVTCTYCNKAQPNPAVLAPGDEVIVWGGARGDHYTLWQVVSCAGPDAIALTLDGGADGRAVKQRLDHVVPVARATPELESGTRVYARRAGGWEATWASSAPADGEVMVKHAHDKFQDAFFDTKIPLGELRVPRRPADRVRRSPWQAVRQQLKADPFGTSVRLFVKVIGGGVSLFIALFFLAIVSAFAYLALREALR